MSGKGLAQLRDLFAQRYDTLRTRVARRLGNAGDMAGDALHEAYVRLAEKGDLDEVRHPQSYLLNTAVHVAIDRLRGESRVLSESEIEDFLDVPDDTPGPAETAEARGEMQNVFTALEALPPRQRDIFLSARVHEVSREELAKRWGISVRQVGRELQAAHEFCLQALQGRDD
ncbi:heme uptake RNA polymerase sigma-70 factor [Bordetella ansorpii]|uniref:Heme uptake RNA polymerase sigma-70 factor n=1 Tax=Bordetella ansorpii TaxID=288768 RepID=A0A157RMC1_9BORD|nr:sigma-70 family RNA polymerase sigma factor [Bordetella ansorpii]SAI59141.1 heme uptake RNA polymerase sigma-70 factor [Bordetella ansorpii]